MEFINPPPFGDVADYSENPVYNEGSRVRVVWTAPEKGQAVTLTLTQLNGTEWMLPMEYLTQSVVDRTSYDWLVVTGKNLSASNMFFFCIFREGQTTSDSNSHYFNISVKEVAPTPSSSATSSPTTTITTTSTTTPILIGVTSSAISTSSVSPTTTANLLPPASSLTTSSGGFSTGAKIGLGIGIPVAILLGLALGFFLFRTRRKRDKTPAITPDPPGDYHTEYSHHNGYYGETVELPSKSPVEMSHADAALNGRATNYTQYAPVKDTTAEPIHHELPAT